MLQRVSIAALSTLNAADGFKKAQELAKRTRLAHQVSRQKLSDHIATHHCERPWNDTLRREEKPKSAAANTLKDIIHFTDWLLEAVRIGTATGSLTPLDKDLENAAGAKERAFGALAQHCKEHGGDG